MEQLAHFVTKSFEYNNNRVLDVINMSTKSIICDNFLKNGVVGALEHDVFSNSSAPSNPSDADEDDTMDIDITDLSSNHDDVDMIKKNCDSSETEQQTTINNFRKSASPVSLIKKTNKDNIKHVTKNWLISDSPKRKFEGNILCEGELFLSYNW